MESSRENTYESFKKIGISWEYMVPIYSIDFS